MVMVRLLNSNQALSRSLEKTKRLFDGLALFENCFFTSNPTVMFPVLFLSQAKLRQLTVDNGKISKTKLGNAQVKGIVNSMMEVADDVVNLSNYGDETEVYVVAEALTNRFGLGILYLRILSFIDLGVIDIAIQELRPGCTWSRIVKVLV